MVKTFGFRKLGELIAIKINMTGNFLSIFFIFNGRQPLLLSIVRFINSKGSIILFIGLDDKDSSPVKVISMPRDAKRPVQ